MRQLTVDDVLRSLDAIAPFDLAESWDHSGFRLGSPHAVVRAVAVALDPCAEVIQAAHDFGADLLITHHPLFFRAAENLVCDTVDAQAAQAAFSLGVHIVSCHTNFDSCAGGVNKFLAQAARLEDVVPLSSPRLETGFGMGAVGTVAEADALSVCDSAARAWGLSGYRYLGSEARVSRVALCGGAGGGLWRSALSLGAQLYITSDMSYHECLEALNSGLRLMLCDHGEMEEPPLRGLAASFAAQTGLPVRFIERKALSQSMSRWRSLAGNV